MIDFRDLDKTQMRYVEQDCPEAHKILNQISSNKVIGANLILNIIISDVIDEMAGLFPVLHYMFGEGDDLLNKTRTTIEYYKLESFLETSNAISRVLKYGDFNTKQHRAWLTEIFGDKVHEEDFMTNLQLVIGKILYAILYV